MMTMVHKVIKSSSTYFKIFRITNKKLFFLFPGTGNAYAFVRYENLDMAHRSVSRDIFSLLKSFPTEPRLKSGFLSVGFDLMSLFTFQGQV